MTRQILNRWTGAVIWSGEAATVKDAIHAAFAMGANLRDANLMGANLRGANLTGADLGGANLMGANLRGADLTGADLGGANLRYANLRGANLRGANLTGADLWGADLRGADLGGADLRDADLRGANLRGANLRDANLRDANLMGADLRGADLGGADLWGADLRPVRDDLWAVLSSAPREVPGLLAALREGRVDGSTYSGACACLVGTLANLRGCAYDEIPGLKPNSARPAERFFLTISFGQTPETHEPSRLAVGWVEEWLANVRGLLDAPTTESRVG